jgi:hypothetical protein
VRLEGLGQMKKKIHLIGTRTRDLPVCSIPRAPTKHIGTTLIQAHEEPERNTAVEEEHLHTKPHPGKHKKNFYILSFLNLKI